MTLSVERAREIMSRISQGDNPESRLDGLKPDFSPPPPPVPRSWDWSEEARQQRVAFFEQRGKKLEHLTGSVPEPDPAELQGNIEQFLGYTRIPTGVIGPLRIRGMFASGDFYVPLATSEGALISSYDRGARVITRSGGASAAVTAEQVQRAPGFAFETLREAALFTTWIHGQLERFQEVTAGRTSHGRLLNLVTHIEANHVYLIFQFYTGDASGQNMVTLCTAEICQDILERTPVQPRFWFLEANMSGDKKATAQSFLLTRGRRVIAETLIPRRLVERGLHTTAERIQQCWLMNFVGGVQTGSIGVSGHVANGIAALFLACGQDVATISEASVGVTRMENRGGDLYCSVTLPNLIVGTVGGGTRLPTARECLALLDCTGDGTAQKLAEICAGVALAGEISICAAMCSHQFAGAHERLGRPHKR